MRLGVLDTLAHRDHPLLSFELEGVLPPVRGRAPMVLARAGPLVVRTLARKCPASQAIRSSWLRTTA